MHDFLALGSLLPKRAVGLPISKASGSRILLTGATGLIGLNILALLLELKCESGLDFDLITTSNSPLPLFLDKGGLEKNHRIINLVGEVDLSPGGHFFFMSSTELYSGLNMNLFKESDIGVSSPSHPRACYIEGKRAGEMFVGWKIADGFKASSVRLSYTYGPGTKPNDLRVINELIRSAITLGETKLQDSGLATRSNLFSIDAAHMILQILLSPNRPVYNVASIETSTIRDLAKEVSTIGNVPFLKQAIGEQINVFAQDHVAIDTSAYFEDFPYFEECSIRNGLTITYNWQRKNLY